jgi:hypothetical protein
MELSSIWRPKRTLQHAEFVALLAAVNVSQAGFTRVCGRQRPAKSINGAGRAGPLAISLRDLSAEASTIQLEELPLASPHQNDPRQLHYLEGKFTPSGRFGNDSHELENATTFARLAGVSPRQVNNWCRNRAKVPRWATLLAVVLRQHSVEALTINAEEILSPPALHAPANT